MLGAIKVVIMAGGKGTRIASVNSDVPKSMFRIQDKPVLEHQICCLQRQGLCDITLVIGHLGSVIKDYFRGGGRWGVKITYVEETEPLGTAGALFNLKDLLREDFILINGDIIFDICFTPFYNFHVKVGGYATIFAYPNSHPYDSALVVTDSENRVIKWIHREEPRTWYKNLTNAGLHILSPSVLNPIKGTGTLDLDRDVLKPLISKGLLYAYESPEYVMDMGTPDRFAQVLRDVNSGLVASKNLNNKQKALFLDRDGTINKYSGFLTNIDEFELIEGISEKIRIANRSGYLVIVVTNQPVIARGELSWDELNAIHNKMETLLGREGAYIDHIFVCPHHPHTGYVGEQPEYKVECDCRKPKPGMLLEAAEKYNIDLNLSFMIGDSSSDMEAGKRAGCKCVWTKDFISGMGVELVGSEFFTANEPLI